MNTPINEVLDDIKRRAEAAYTMVSDTSPYWNVVNSQHDVSPLVEALRYLRTQFIAEVGFNSEMAALFDKRILFLLGRDRV